jgi:hypothetical protein
MIVRCIRHVLAAAGLPGAASGEADFLENLDNLVNLSSRAGGSGSECKDVLEYCLGLKTPAFHPTASFNTKAVQPVAADSMTLGCLHAP